MKALVRLDPPVYRSKQEANYALRLELRKECGNVHDWRYEPIRLAIGQRGKKTTYYKPDFMVIGDFGEVIFVEVKGSWAARGGVASKARLAAAAKLYPWFRFIAVMSDGTEEEF